MIQDSALTNIRQLAMEVHTPELHTVARSATREDLYNMYEILLALEKIGFRRYRVHANNQGRYLSARTGKPQTCCYEMYFLNINFLRWSSQVYMEIPVKSCVQFLEDAGFVYIFYELIFNNIK